LLSKRLVKLSLKKVIEIAGKTGLKAAAVVTPTIEVNPLRAVSAAEAPHMKPGHQAITTTMMPWKGWINCFLKDKTSDKQYDLMRDTLYFMKDDLINMQQVPFPNTQYPIHKDGTTAAYREVYPGSQGPVDVPLHELDDDPYDSGYFKRDMRRIVNLDSLDASQTEGETSPIAPGYYQHILII
jgi:hypothetical protein